MGVNHNGLSHWLRFLPRPILSSLHFVFKLLIQQDRNLTLDWRALNTLLVLTIISRMRSTKVVFFYRHMIVSLVLRYIMLFLSYCAEQRKESTGTSLVIRP